MKSFFKKYFTLEYIYLILCVVCLLIYSFTDSVQFFNASLISILLAIYYGPLRKSSGSAPDENIKNNNNLEEN